MEAVTRPVVSWADASEEVLASVLSSDLEHPAEAEQSQGLSGEVEEEIIQPTSEVPVADGFSEEVAGDNAAMDRVAGEITFSEVAGLEERANNDLGLCKQEEDQQPLSSSSAGIVFQAADQLEGTETSNLGEDAIAAGVVKAEVEAEGPPAETLETAASVQPEIQNSGLSEELVAVGSQEASEPALASAKPEVVDTTVGATESPGVSVDSAVLETSGVSEPSSASAQPGVVDTSVVATTTNTQLDTSDFAAPPTSPNLVEPGVEPIRTGHSPSAPSAGPKQRTRRRSSRGGQTTRNQEANRAWFSDLDTFRDYCIKIQEGGQAVVSG